MSTSSKRCVLGWAGGRSGVGGSGHRLTADALARQASACISLAAMLQPVVALWPTGGARGGGGKAAAASGAPCREAYDTAPCMPHAHGGNMCYNRVVHWAYWGELMYTGHAPACKDLPPPSPPHTHTDVALATTLEYGRAGQYNYFYTDYNRSVG